MKVIIIDDEYLAREHVKECLKPHKQIEVIAECEDGFKGLKAIQELNPDLIFLDIQMPKISGFEMLELLDQPPKVIFTTAFDEFALKAFEANAIDYLLKPFGQDRFDRALQKVISAEYIPSEIGEVAYAGPGESNRLVVKHHGEIRIIAAEEILYIEAWDDYVKVHTPHGVFVKKKTLNYYEKNLSDKEFVRCHRSFLVNIRQITGIEHSGSVTWELRLANGFHIPASRSGYTRLKSVLGI
jgi:two-component system, LytTR family, response regulator